jgi:hypothetical protein
MGDNFRQNFEEIQRQLQKRSRQFGGGIPGGGPKFIGGAAGLVILGGGAFILSNSLFNGMSCIVLHWIYFASSIITDTREQSTEVTEPSSTPV